MSKLTPKEIGRMAGRQFGAVVPANWALRSQEDQEDYGIDYEVELTTASDQATGFIFKIQQKGVESPSWTSNGKILSFSGIAISKLDYYLRQLKIPVIFVVVDVSTGSCYWIELQGNAEVEKRLREAKDANHQTLTLHVPSKNKIPGTIDDLLRSVEHMQDHLTIAALKGMPVPDAYAVIEKEPNLDDLERALQVQQSLVRTARTQRLIDSGSMKEAFELNLQAFRNVVDPIECRFTAALELIRIASLDTANPARATANEELIKLRIFVSHELVEVVYSSPSPRHLRRYAAFLARVARLRLRIDQDLGILLSRKAQARMADELTQWMTKGAQHKSTALVVTEFRKCQRHIIAVLQQRSWGLLFQMWLELTEAIIPFLLRLREDDLASGAEAIVVWLDNVGEVCALAAERANDERSLEMCALNYMRIGFGSDDIPSRVTGAKRISAKLGDEARERAQQGIDDIAKRLTSRNDNSGSPLTPDELHAHFRHIARGLGIDIDDPGDDIASIVRIGIADANPERVLRDCQKLHVSIDSYGIPAEMMGLPTAGFKSIHCILHGHRMSSASLDGLYATFQQMKCATCQDKTPHDPGWTWSKSWQSEQARLYDDEKARRRANVGSISTTPGEPPDSVQ